MVYSTAVRRQLQRRSRSCLVWSHVSPIWRLPPKAPSLLPWTAFYTQQILLSFPSFFAARGISTPSLLLFAPFLAPYLLSCSFGCGLLATPHIVRLSCLMIVFVQWRGLWKPWKSTFFIWKWSFHHSFPKMGSTENCPNHDKPSRLVTQNLSMCVCVCVYVCHKKSKLAVAHLSMTPPKVAHKCLVLPLHCNPP